MGDKKDKRRLEGRTKKPRISKKYELSSHHLPRGYVKAWERPYDDWM